MQSVAKNLTDFFCISERLECEKRLTRNSVGKHQTVAAHSWNMAIMAMTIEPYLVHHVDMKRVLELCLLHDLPESIAHDIPLHKQTENIKKQKYTNEKKAIDYLTNLVQNDILSARFNEYEEHQTAESKLVKTLDVLDTGIQHMCAKDLAYVGKYKNNFYWKLFFSDKYTSMFDYEPIVREIFNEIRTRVTTRLRKEQGIDAKIFYNQDTNK